MILIKSSYDIFLREHFFALLDNWVNCASFGTGTTVTHNRFKLTLKGFKIVIASFWIKNKLLCTIFESDFQRSFYVISVVI